MKAEGGFVALSGAICAGDYVGTVRLLRVKYSTNRAEFKVQFALFRFSNTTCRLICVPESYLHFDGERILYIPPLSLYTRFILVVQCTCVNINNEIQTVKTKELCQSTEQDGRLDKYLLSLFVRIIFYLFNRAMLMWHI
jgi:hypothetical protein